MSDDISSWTADNFRPHVDDVIQQLRAGDLFTEYGLTEADSILLEEEKSPSRSNKGHKFNVLLEAVATKLVKENGFEKKLKKSIFKQLHKFNSEWAEAIRNHPPKRSSSSKITKEKPKEPGVVASEEEKEVVDTTIDDTTEQWTEHEEPPPTPKKPPAKKQRAGALTDKQLAEKEIFESERDEILREIPDNVKSRFGQIMFSKWSNSYLPVLVLSPFTVSPGPVRDMWYTMYEKVKAAQRLQSMTHLVYWYGAYQDPVNAYSFLTLKKLIPYDVGVKKGYDQAPKPGKKKVNEQLVRGLEEMKEDLEKPPEERSGRMGTNFLEVYMLPSDSDNEVDNTPDEKTKTKKWGRKKKTAVQTADTKGFDQEGERPKKKKPGRKRKHIETETEDLTESEGNILKNKKKKKKLKKVQDDADPAGAQQEQPVADKEGDATTHQASENATTDQFQQVHTFQPIAYNSADDDIPSDDDKDDEEAEPESESDDDDAEFTLHTSKPKAKKKRKKLEPKQPPKKKAKKVKVKKQEITMPEKVKKVPSQAKLKKLEKTLFEECEQNFLPIIDRWETALETHDTVSLDELYEDINAVVTQFSAPFIEAYELPKLIKRSKLVHDTPQRKQLFLGLKNVYTTKKAEVPVGFTIKGKKRKKQTKKKPLETDQEPKPAKDLDSEKESGLAKDPKDEMDSKPGKEVRAEKSPKRDNEAQAEEEKKGEKEVKPEKEAKTEQVTKIENDTQAGKDAKIEKSSKPEKVSEASGLKQFGELKDTDSESEFDRMKEEKDTSAIPSRKNEKSPFQETTTQSASPSMKRTGSMEKVAVSDQTAPPSMKRTGSMEKVAISDQAAPPSMKRTGSMEKVVVADQDTKSVSIQRKETPVKFERKKKFSLGSLMRPSSAAPKAAPKSNPMKVVAPASQPAQQRQMPAWISQTSADSPGDQNRRYALEFFQQAAPFIPQGKHVNHDAIALALEAAVFEWAEGMSKGGTNWHDKYWEKVHEIVSSISGKQKKPGTIAGLIAEGRFKSAKEIIQLPDDVHIDSFEGRSVTI